MQDETTRATASTTEAPSEVSGTGSPVSLAVEPSPPQILRASSQPLFLRPKPKPPLHHCHHHQALRPAIVMNHLILILPMNNKIGYLEYLSPVFGSLSFLPWDASKDGAWFWWCRWYPRDILCSTCWQQGLGFWKYIMSIYTVHMKQCSLFVNIFGFTKYISKTCFDSYIYTDQNPFSMGFKPLSI